MSLNATTYGTIVGLTPKCAWLVPDRAFDGSSIPTLTEAEEALNQTASQIHAKLAEAGYAIETLTTVTSDAPRAEEWLARVNEAGAAADLIQGFAIADDPEARTTPSAFWRKIFEDGLKMIAGSFLSEMGLSKNREKSQYLTATSLDNEDGKEKLPLFRRSTFDAPGARSLTKE